MSRVLLFVLSAIFILSLNVVTCDSERVTLETDIHPMALPTGEWEVYRSILPTDIVDLMIVFRKSDSAMKELEERFWAVSDPAHADYGKFLSSSEIKRIVQVPLSYIESLTDWLKSGSSSCTTKVGPDGDTLRVQMLAADASRLCTR